MCLYSLLGGGENGKGILEKLVLALYTMQRASALKIEEVSKSHFASGSLLNKDFWIITEVETIKDAMSVIKGVVYWRNAGLGCQIWRTS